MPGSPRCLAPCAVQQAPSTALPHPSPRSPCVSPDVSCCLREPLSPQSSPWGPDRRPVPPTHGGPSQLVWQWTGPPAFRAHGLLPAPKSTWCLGGAVHECTQPSDALWVSLPAQLASQVLSVTAPLPEGAELSVVAKGSASRGGALRAGPRLPALTGRPLTGSLSWPQMTWT